MRPSFEKSGSRANFSDAMASVVRWRSTSGAEAFCTPVTTSLAGRGSGTKRKFATQGLRLGREKESWRRRRIGAYGDEDEADPDEDMFLREGGDM